VKGGRFALSCAPAKVYAIVLSDIVGDPLDMIASGPAYPDSTTCTQAKEIVRKYGIKLSEEARACLGVETPKELTGVTTFITGSVRELCAAAEYAARQLGYETEILTTELSCEAKEAGAWLARLAGESSGSGKKRALIAGGETVVKLTGTGKGGRNQELALAAAEGIDGMENVCIFSIGSDGTDGPTDAAGGYVDGTTAGKLRSTGISIPQILKNNDAYHALEKTGGLIITGPTGTNVNDVAVLLLDC
jgi:hydroxypyruvate reductase